MSALCAAARRNPLFAALFILCAVASITPIWIGRYLPLLDYPNHLSMVFVWFHLDDPHWNFAQYYSTNLPPLPYWAQYASIYALSYVVPTEIAQKLYFSASIIGLAAAVAVYARQTDRDWRLAVFAFPLAWNFSTSNGFLSYTSALPVLFLALAALDRFGERPTVRWGVIAALLGALLYFFHILAWGLFLLIGGFATLAAPRRPGVLAALIAPLPTLPAFGLGIWAYRAAKSMSGPFNPNTPGGLMAFRGAHDDVAVQFTGVFRWMMDFFPGGSDDAVAAFLAVGWLLLITLRPPAERAAMAGSIETSLPELNDRRPRDWRVEIAMIVSAIIMFALPRSLIAPFYWYAVNYRVGVVTALLAVLSTRGPVAGPRRPILVACAIAGAVYCLDVARHFHSFNLRARDYDSVMEGVPFGKQVLPLMLDKGAPEVRVNCYNQWGTWVQLHQGGYIPFNFVGEFPIRYKKRLAAPPWDRPEHFNWDAHAREWDYFLVHSLSPHALFRGHEEDARLAAKKGEWELWEKVPPAVK